MYFVFNNEWEFCGIINKDALDWETSPFFYNHFHICSSIKDVKEQYYQELFDADVLEFFNVDDFMKDFELKLNKLREQL